MLIFSISLTSYGQQAIPPCGKIVGCISDARTYALLKANRFRTSTGLTGINGNAVYNQGGRLPSVLLNAKPLIPSKMYSSSVRYNTHAPNLVSYGYGASKTYNHSFYSGGYSPPITKRPSGNKIRTFTCTNGKTVEARLLSISATSKTARIRTRKGLSYNVPIVRFCSTDIKFLKSWWYARNPSPKKTKPNITAKAKVTAKAKPTYRISHYENN